MSGMSGLQLQALLREQALALPVIIITAHGDVAAARQAFMAEAVDFLEKPFDGEQLLHAVDCALARLRAGTTTPITPPPVTAGSKLAATAGPAPHHGVQGVANFAARPMLSPREQEVMHLLVQGMPNRRIAEELGISHRTVEVHKARIMDKLGARGLDELIRIMSAK